MSKSNSDEDPCVVTAEMLAIIDDFLASAADGTLDEKERSANGDHPIVLLIEAALEAITTHMGRKIAGLSSETVTELRTARRKLKPSRRNDSSTEVLDTLLYSFELAVENISESVYEGRDRELDETLFGELFPQWLESLIDWARAKECDDLAETAEDYLERYLEVVDEIVE